MNQTFSQIDWDAANVFRLATVIVLSFLLLEFVLMLSHYYWRVIPLRKQIDVVSPPIRWTFAYHFVITLLVASIWISTFQRMTFDHHHSVTLSTWVTPVLGLALWVIVRQFVKYYSRSLNQAEHDHLH